MKKMILILPFLFSCSSQKSIKLVNLCNQEKTKCNKKAHQEICGENCIKRLIEDSSGEDSLEFESRVRQCDEDYKVCLNQN